jgi:predicted ATPase
MIESIKFRSGGTPQSSSLLLQPTAVTVFVGPNNSGKSIVLNEIGSWSTQGQSEGKVVEQVIFQTLSVEEIVEELQKSLVSPQTDIKQLIASGVNVQLELAPPFGGGTYNYSLTALVRGATSTDPDHQRAYANRRQYFVKQLTGAPRLNLLNPLPIGNLSLDYAENYLAKLFQNDALRHRLRRIVFDAIGEFFVLDHTSEGMLRVKLSKRAPDSAIDEKMLTPEIARFYQGATPIDQASDGIRAFVGILTLLIADEPKITLIDEPEAFLHPALAMRLGTEVCRLVDEAKRLFVSTHSAAFLMGCIQSGAHVSIVRLTYTGGVATTRILEQSKLLHLMRNPLLRSTGVLEGLFYEAVVVTEAAADRAFYQEVNERLRADSDQRGMGNCLFINAQNKQTVWDIVKPLRDLGIPAVGVVDLDMLKDSVIKMLQSASVPSVQQQPLSTLAASIRFALDQVTPDWKTTGGISLLSGETAEAARNLFEQLESYGIFIVRSGELESWLAALGVPTKKEHWLRRMFERMGEDPAAPDYVKPTPGEVWDFIGRIRQWVDNPNRLGIPK